MLKLNNLSVVKNIRVNENISFSGVVANSRKGTFTISPVLAKKLKIGEADSALLLTDTQVDNNGNQVVKYYLAKGLTYVPVLDAEGNKVRQSEGMMKFKYEDNTGFGSLVRETVSNMFTFTNAAVWNVIHGNPGKMARFEVGEVQQIELNPKDLGGNFDKDFIADIVEILVDTKKEKKAPTRTASVTKTGEEKASTQNVVVTSDDDDVTDFDDENDDDFGDDE